MQYVSEQASIQVAQLPPIDAWHAKSDEITNHNLKLRFEIHSCIYKLLQKPEKY